MKQIKLMRGDNIESLKKLPDNSIDSVVSDVPYGLGKEQDMNVVLKDWLDKGYSEIKGSGFMGKVWDSYVPQPIFWKEVYRVLKPGGHVLSFFGTRTYDIGTMAIRLAGFEIRDQIMWIYGSGFPKSHNIGKSYDKVMENEREVVGILENYQDKRGLNGQTENVMENAKPRIDIDVTKGTSEWEGWGTALKPANEPICVARKPLSEKTIVANVIRWGVGGINIDGCRIEGAYGKGENEIIEGKEAGQMYHRHEDELANNNYKQKIMVSNPEGRFPANIIFDETAAAMLDEQTGILKGDSPNRGPRKGGGIPNFIDQENKRLGIVKENDTLTPNKFSGNGGASRFFYVPKVSKKERNMGLEGFEDKIMKQHIVQSEGRTDAGKNESSVPTKNFHPTLKPINLMTYLCRLVTPPGGIVLDPFMGSGSTGISACLEGFRFVGMEMDEDYFKIAEARVNAFEEYRPLLKQ